MADPQSVQALSKLFRARYPIAHRLELVLAGRVFVVETNSAALDEELRSYFNEFTREFVGEPDADAPAPVIISAFQGDAPSFATEFTVPPLERGKKRLKETYLEVEDGRLVHKVRTGMKFAFGGDLDVGGDACTNLAMGPCEANPNQVINFVNNRLISWILDNGAELAHAAAVALPSGSAVSIAGFSGMGKSTLSLHLMSAAPLVFISNDRALMRKKNDGVEIIGVPKHPRINPGTALNNDDLIKIMSEKEKKEFSRLAPQELWELEHKYDAIVEECYGPGRFRLRANMKAFVVLNWHHGAGEPKIGRFSAKDRPDLLEAIMKPAGLFHRPGMPLDQPNIAKYEEVLADTPIVEIAGGVDFEAAAQYCLALLDELDGSGN